MESWSSDFVFEEHLSWDELVVRVAQLKAYDGARQEPGWNEIHWHETAPEQDDYGVQAPAETEARKLREAANAARIQEVENKKRRDAEHIKREELQQLGRLKAKYEGARDKT